MTPWNLVAAMCGLLLALYKASTVAIAFRTKLSKVKKEVKRRKTIQRSKKLEQRTRSVDKADEEVCVTVENGKDANDKAQNVKEEMV